jgi:hypothetical protein
MRSIHAAVVVAFAALTACQAAPRARPVKMGPTDTGPTSVEAERRRLQGAWDLVSLDVVLPSGEKHAVPATGRLEYDDYGNLTMRGKVQGTEQVDPAVLNVSARVTIDPDSHSFQVMNVQSRTADDRRLDPSVDASKKRYYEFDGDLLKTTVKNAQGVTTAVVTWKRAG